jgi:hypothetical protein
MLPPLPALSLRRRPRTSRPRLGLSPAVGVAAMRGDRCPHRAEGRGPATDCGSADAAATCGPGKAGRARRDSKR